MNPSKERCAAAQAAVRELRTAIETGPPLTHGPRCRASLDRIELFLAKAYSKLPYERAFPRPENTSEFLLAALDAAGPDEDEDDDGEDEDEGEDEDMRLCDLPAMAGGAQVRFQASDRYALTIDHMVDGAPRVFFLTAQMVQKLRSTAWRAEREASGVLPPGGYPESPAADDRKARA